MCAECGGGHCAKTHEIVVVEAAPSRTLTLYALSHSITLASVCISNLGPIVAAALRIGAAARLLFPPSGCDMFVIKI